MTDHPTDDQAVPKQKDLHIAIMRAISATVGKGELNLEQVTHAIYSAAYGMLKEQITKEKQRDLTTIELLEIVVSMVGEMDDFAFVLSEVIRDGEKS